MARIRTLHTMIHKLDDAQLKCLWFLRHYHGNNERDITQRIRDEIKLRIKAIRATRSAA